jgi:hypothetical protein
MKPDRLAAVGEAIYGEWWQTQVARELGISARHVRRWLSGAAPIPERVEAALMELAAERIERIRMVIKND